MLTFREWLKSKEVKEDAEPAQVSQGTTSADVATVDNKINLGPEKIVSRGLHKRLKVKDNVEGGMIPVAEDQTPKIVPAPKSEGQDDKVEIVKEA